MNGRQSSTATVLDRQIVLQSKTETRDAAGGVVVTYADKATVWAAKRWISGDRFYAASEKHGLDILVYRIRHRLDVVRFWRVVHGTITYEIVALEEIGRRQFLDLTLRAIDQNVANNSAAA